MILLLTSVFAGELVLYKGGLVGGFAHVDGELAGKVQKEKKAIRMELPAGPHEVWMSVDDGGIYTMCHGLVEVPAEGSVEVKLSITMDNTYACSNLTEGVGEKTAFKGATAPIQVEDGFLSVDSGRKMAMPAVPFELNLEPGQHTVVLYTDVSGDAVIGQGMLTLEPGDTRKVMCTVGGCMGFDSE
jgi:hypothetical protein